MQNKILSFIILFLFSATVLYATDNKKLPADSFSDIFLTSQKADILVVPSQDAKNASITWKNKLCALNTSTPAKDVIDVTITPQKQHVFLKKIIGMQKAKCKVRIEVPEGKKIYTSSETGTIKFQGINAKSVKIYTSQGYIEANNHKGALSAETLTGRITVRNINTGDLFLKSANGTINMTGYAQNADILNTSGLSRFQGVVDNLRFYSASGSLYAKWDSISQDSLKISARSSSGMIKLMLPPGTNLEDKKHTVDIKSIYGTVTIAQ